MKEKHYQNCGLSKYLKINQQSLIRLKWKRGVKEYCNINKVRAKINIHRQRGGESN